MRVFRKLLPAELGAYREHLLRLAPADRQCRFFGQVSDDAIAAHCAGINWGKTVLLGCLVDGMLRGAAELQFDDPCLGWRCELAITVDHDYQEQRIGTELMRRSIVLCRNRSSRSIYMICLIDNGRMQRIARKFDGDLSFADSEAEAEVVLPFPTQLTLAAEALDESAAWASAWWSGLERLARGRAI